MIPIQLAVCLLHSIEPSKLATANHPAGVALSREQGEPWRQDDESQKPKPAYKRDFLGKVQCEGR